MCRRFALKIAQLLLGDLAFKALLPHCIYSSTLVKNSVAAYYDEMTEKRVLLLCTGNSCRSQLAEAIVNHDLAGQWQAFSAGTEPAGYVHPMAFKALEELGIHHHGVSKSVEQFRNASFDLVITLCDDAAENCPVWLGKGKKAHISFPDPAKVQGTEEEIMAAFRQVRDDIRQKVIHYLQQYSKESDAISQT